MAATPVPFRIVFQTPPPELLIEVSQGAIRWEREAGGSIAAEATGARVAVGPPATVVRVGPEPGWSFFLRDVRHGRPIFCPELGVAVTAGGDEASYADIASRHPSADPVAPCDLEAAEQSCEGPVVPVWLALGGDARIFLISFAEDHGCWGWITPWRFHKPLLHADGTRVEWDFTVGRGSHYRHDLRRSLEDGNLPIVHSDQFEEAIHYHVTAFANTDTGTMSVTPPRGTEWQAATLCTMGCMFSEEKTRELAALFREEVEDREDRPVCCLRVTAANTGSAPAYAFYRMPSYKPNHLPPMYPSQQPRNDQLRLDTASGFCYEDGAVFSINRLNGEPLPNEEVAVLLEPGEEVSFECLLPFRPLAPEAATRLNQRRFDELHRDCRDYWRQRLGQYPTWQLPESGLQKRLEAANLHFAINLLGERHRAESPLLATVGVYAPIGTESTAFLWHLDAMGLHEEARRCLDYFYEMQREDGYIQSFNFYDAETGPVLANSWRHYRITGNVGWLERRREGVARACHYLMERRKRTMEEDGPAHPGYGMLSGKIADPDEYYHQFSLNAEAAEGLYGGAEILKALGDPRGESVAAAARALAQSTVAGFERAFADAPLVPTSDGSWAPLVGAWPGPRGEVSLYAERGRWFTHGAFHLRAQAFLKLIRCGLVAADDRRMAAAVRALENHVLRDFTGPSQPYNHRCDYYYAATGQTEKFSNLFYRQLARLQDRETLTFWEHYYKLSSQKINEEAWFVQQLTWMICFEEGNGLTFLKMAPCSWFKPGMAVRIPALATPFGKMAIEARFGESTMEIAIERTPAPVSNPARIGIRFPRNLFGGASEGVWNPIEETLELNPTPTEYRVTVDRATAANGP